MKTNQTCRVCGVELDDDNWNLSWQKKRDYICKECNSRYHRLYRKNNPEKVKERDAKSSLKKGHLPMNENKECSLYLGVFLAERVLNNIYPDVIRMPMNNPGYDIICNKGKKIDVKSGCIMKNQNSWMFHINHNTTADYFVCVAFDNREDLNPVHIWMLPGKKFNHLRGASISQSTLYKWAEYEQDISEVIICCDKIKSE